MMEMKRPTAVFAAAALGLAAVIWLLFNVRQAGLPVSFTVGLVAGAILLVVAVAALAVIVRPAFTVAGSLIASAVDGLRRNHYVKHFRTVHPRVSAWCGNRFASGRPTGRLLTTGIVAAIGLLAAFAALAKDVVLRDEIVDLDQYVTQAYVGIRTPGQTGFFEYMTNLAGIEAMAIFMVGLAIVSWKHKVLPLVFGVALGLTVVISQGLKLVFGRLRPDEAFHLVVENGFSFPSGHTFVATVMFGLSGYVLWRTAAGMRGRLMAAIGSVVAIVLVASSRNYLGVHFLSDVLASMFVGSAVLVLIITAVEINERFRLRPQYVLVQHARRPLIQALAILAVVSLGLTIFHG